MVSISGYSITEFVFFALMSYVLLFFAMTTWFIVELLKGGKTLWLAMVGGISVVFALCLVVIYATDVRLGTVMFINGLLFSAIIANSLILKDLWKDRMNG